MQEHIPQTFPTLRNLKKLKLDLLLADLELGSVLNILRTAPLLEELLMTVSNNYFLFWCGKGLLPNFQFAAFHVLGFHSREFLLVQSTISFCQILGSLVGCLSSLVNIITYNAVYMAK